MLRRKQTKKIIVIIIIIMIIMIIIIIMIINIISYKGIKGLKDPFKKKFLVNWATFLLKLKISFVLRMFPGRRVYSFDMIKFFDT